MPEQPTFTLTLTVDQINLLAAALDELPHKTSRKTMDAITGQVMAQQQERSAAQMREQAAKAEAPAREPIEVYAAEPESSH